MTYQGPGGHAPLFRLIVSTDAPLLHSAAEETGIDFRGLA